LKDFSSDQPSPPGRFLGVRPSRLQSHEHVTKEPAGLAVSHHPIGQVQDLSAFVQLVEAACRAREGDHEGAKSHIAHAVRLLQRAPSPSPGLTPPRSAKGNRAMPPCLLAWQSRRILAHIESNLSRKICVRELGLLVGLSTSHFARAFKRTLGASPHIYVLRRRIEVAQGMMLTSSESLSEIALACGMFDQPHFTRSFRRMVGETPHLWRRTRLEALNLYQLA
jgi:AraC family transcriptional regulator